MSRHFSRFIEDVQAHVVDYMNCVVETQKRFVKYTIRDVAELVIKSCKDKQSRQASIELKSSLSGAPKSAIAYWSNRVIQTDLRGLFTSTAQSCINYTYNSQLTSKPRWFAVDGTVITTPLTDKTTSLSHSSVSCIIDLHSALMCYANIDDRCNENAMFQQQLLSLPSNSGIVADRGYCAASTLRALHNADINFVIRAKSNLLYLREFILGDADHTTVTHNGVQMNVFKTTNLDDNESIWILLTNVQSLTMDECVKLYKSRWKIETAFKQIKTNFNFRRPLKVVNHSFASEMIEYNVLMSLIMYNLSISIRRHIDKTTSKTHTFTSVSDYIQSIVCLMSNNRKRATLSLIRLIVLASRGRVINKTSKTKTPHPKVPGRYKSRARMLGVT